MKKLFLWSFVNANTGKLESRFFYATPTVEGNKTRISREAFYGVMREGVSVQMPPDDVQ